MKQSLNVVLLFGGKSAEHEVSIRSAKSVYRALQQTNHTIKLIYITKNGIWLDVNDKQLVLPLSEFITLMTDVEEKSKRSLKQFYLSTQIQDIDIVFPILHGPYGEDGTIQAFLKLVGIPFVGSSVLGSAIGMDKDVMKRLLKEANLPIVPFQVVRRHEKGTLSYNELVEKLGSPFFIKPANLGSSIGVHKIHDEVTFLSALDDAFSYDNKIILEQAVDAREIECSVLGNEEPLVSVSGEITPHHTFYSYDAKYLDPSGAGLHIPADISDTQRKIIQDLAVHTFKTLCASGLARVDFFIDKKTDAIYINEINTIPGFTNISMYPALWKASGIDYPELITRLLQFGIERFQQEAMLRVTKD